jgi:archaellum biogenesis protein FlaJ (TadC family)
MPAFLKQLFAHEGFVLWVTLSSVAMFVASLVAVPWIIARAPQDFFTNDGSSKSGGSIALKILKNVVGLILLLAGVLMLLLPGQGILTLIVGLALMDLPGKHALLVRLAKKPSVFKALNYVRGKAKREPFDAP